MMNSTFTSSSLWTKVTKLNQEDRKPVKYFTRPPTMNIWLESKKENRKPLKKMVSEKY